MRIPEIKIQQLIGRTTNGSRSHSKACIQPSDTFRRGAFPCLGHHAASYDFLWADEQRSHYGGHTFSMQVSSLQDRGRYHQVWGGFENWLEDFIAGNREDMTHTMIVLA